MILGEELAEDLALFGVLRHVTLDLAWHVPGLVQRGVYSTLFCHGGPKRHPGPDQAAVINLGALQHRCLPAQAESLEREAQRREVVGGECLDANHISIPNRHLHPAAALEMILGADLQPLWQMRVADDSLPSTTRVRSVLPL